MDPEEWPIPTASVLLGEDRVGSVTIVLVCVLAGSTVGLAVATNGGLAHSIVQDDAPNQTKFVGVGEGDRLGHAVAAGDVNGDGVSDLVVGAPANDSSGAVYLFFGPVESNTRNASSADATFVGETTGDHAGFAVAAGDVNGDGVSDLVVGAPHNDDGGDRAGATYVVYGGESISGTMSLSAAAAKLVGETADAFAGFSVAVRDVDASADPSVLLGAPTNVSTPGTGTAYLFAADSLSGTASLSTADTKLVGEAEGDLTGWAVAWAGDVTNDSAVNAVVGAPGHDANRGEDAGLAYVVDADVNGTASLANVTDAKLIGTNAEGHFGFSVAGAGDVNGDGVDDLLVGAPYSDRRKPNAGAARLFLGSESLTGTVDAAIAPISVFGEAPGDRFGWSVAGSVDVDCDDRADVLVGAPFRDTGVTDAGTAYVVFGKSTADSVAVARLSGNGVGNLAGFDLVGGGDSAADDGDDVLVGAPFYGADSDQGAAYLWPGSCNASVG